jgi:hypothetical protein
MTTESEPLPVINDEDENLDSYERYFPPKLAALVGNGALPSDLSFLGEEVNRQSQKVRCDVYCDVFPLDL